MTQFQWIRPHRHRQALRCNLRLKSYDKTNSDGARDRGQLIGKEDRRHPQFFNSSPKMAPSKLLLAANRLWQGKNWQHANNFLTDIVSGLKATHTHIAQPISDRLRSENPFVLSRAQRAGLAWQPRFSTVRCHFWTFITTAGSRQHESSSRQALCTHSTELLIRGAEIFRQAGARNFFALKAINYVTGPSGPSTGFVRAGIQRKKSFAHQV